MWHLVSPSEYLVNTFIEGKKLYFNTKKCLRPKCEECPELKVHNLKMRKTTVEEYLGDVVSIKGNIENIENSRKLADIRYHVHFKRTYYVKTGLMLRDAVLKCKLLLNSEIWSCLTV